LNSILARLGSNAHWRNALVISANFSNPSVFDVTSKICR
jgi:hypothetical protein